MSEQDSIRARTSPFLSGFSAYRAGVKVGDNPHCDTTDAHWRWMQGWCLAGQGKIQKQSDRREAGEVQGE